MTKREKMTSGIFPVHDSEYVLNKHFLSITGIQYRNRAELSAQMILVEYTLSLLLRKR